MLHFECYSNSALKTGLTDKSKSGGAYKRRSDLMDPTNLLDGARVACRQTLASWMQLASKMPFQLDTRIAKKQVT